MSIYYIINAQYANSLNNLNPNPNQNPNQNPNPNSNSNPSSNKKSLNPLLIGLLAGAAGASVVYPIDVVKTQMQNQNNKVNKVYKNGFDCWKQLWKQGGFKPFYRGYMTQMMGVAPEKAVKLLAYSWVTSYYNSSSKEKDKLSTHILGGIAAGTCQVMITSPYEMIKINLQMNNKINYFELLNIKKLYTGVSACFLRDIPFSGIYFPTYWYLKEKKELNPFFAGIIAGTPAAFLCTPADVIKTRMQTLRNQTSTNCESIKIIQTAKSIYINEGWSAFWKGGGWRVLRSSPQFGITLFVFEYLQKI